MSETKKKSRRVGKYEIGISLGEGTFGKVKKAVNVETGEVVAIKILDKEKIQKQNMGSQVKKEISIMKLVRHHFVVKLKEVLASKTKIFIRDYVEIKCKLHTTVFNLPFVYQNTLESRGCRYARSL